MDKWKIKTIPSIISSPGATNENILLKKVSKKQKAKTEVEDKSKSNSNYQFYCLICSYTTNRKSRMDDHYINKHTPDEEIKWFKCEECSYKAKQSSNLKTHMKVHDASEYVQSFECEYCPYVAKRKPNLQRHVIAKHTLKEDINWFQCEECSYKTKNSYDLTRHVKTCHDD